MAKSKDARMKKKKYGYYLMDAEDRFVCVYCEVVQKIKNGSNHIRVCKKYLEECGRLEAIAKKKKAHAETGRKYYHGVTSRRRRNDKEIEKDFLNLLGSDRKFMPVAKKMNQVPL
jgi:RPA family protein